MSSPDGSEVRGLCETAPGPGPAAG